MDPEEWSRRRGSRPWLYACLDKREDTALQRPVQVSAALGRGERRGSAPRGGQREVRVAGRRELEDGVVGVIRGLGA